VASVFKRGGKRAKGYYYASWFDHNGKRKTLCTRTTDKATAERIARKHESDAAARRQGVVDRRIEYFATEAKRFWRNTWKTSALDYTPGRTAQSIQA